VDGNRSTDVQVAAAADAQGRVVVTKDRDFHDWHWLGGTPGQLLIVATGNISNESLRLVHSRAPSSLWASDPEVNGTKSGPGWVDNHDHGSAGLHRGRRS
jgi:hypothetical protein